MNRSKIAELTWENKYKAPVDKTLDDTYQRVAAALTGFDKPIQSYNFPSVHKEYDLLYEELRTNRFIPAGRIFSAAGLDKRKVTYLNCFVSGVIPDSIQGIFDTITEAAVTQKYGGGIGFDFSPIRPKGARVVGAASPASGPLSFAHVFNSMCSTIMSAGSRRGAQMLVMRVDHPDIIEFIHAKNKNEYIEKVTDPILRRELYQQFGALRNFNISVAVTKEFMEALEKDTDWYLTSDHPKNGSVVYDDIKGPYIYQVIKARELWDMIMRSTYEFSEPGVIFIDRVNDLHNLKWMENIVATNPCGEEPLAPNDSCCLGAINLSQFTTHPFTNVARVDYDKLVHTTKVAVRALDAVRDVTQYPTEAQREKGNSTRRIGLGVMGLGTLFQMTGLKYGDQASLDITNYIFKTIAETAYKESIKLAKINGPFPAYDRKKFSEAPFLQKLSSETRYQIDKHGIRNGVLLTVAPTGTTALAFGDNCSSGIEPVFALNYRRNVRKDGSEQYEAHDVEDYGSRLFTELYPGDKLPGYITESITEKLTPQTHLNIMKVVQYWIDASISKTINVNSDCSFEDFKRLYTIAYEYGCKGCTTYRPSDVRGSILETTDTKPWEKYGSYTTLCPKCGIQSVISKKGTSICLSCGFTAPYETDETETFTATVEEINPGDKYIGMSTPDIDGKLRTVKSYDGTKENNTWDRIEDVPDFLKPKTEIAFPPAQKKKTPRIVDTRPSILESKTYYLPAWPLDDCSRYVTISNRDGRPWEIFINTKSTNAAAETMALARILSALFRRTEDPGFLADVLKEIHAPHGGSWINGTFIPSLPAAYGMILEAHLKGETPKFAEKKKPPMDTGPDAQDVKAAYENILLKTEGYIPARGLCPKCGLQSAISRDGCLDCLSCGYTTCV